MRTTKKAVRRECVTTKKAVRINGVRVRTTKKAVRRECVLLQIAVRKRVRTSHWSPRPVSEMRTVRNSSQAYGDLRVRSTKGGLQ